MDLYQVDSLRPARRAVWLLGKEEAARVGLRVPRQQSLFNIRMSRPVGLHSRIIVAPDSDAVRLNVIPVWGALLQEARNWPSLFIGSARVTVSGGDREGTGFRLLWGYVNRADLMDAFGVSVNQASTDLNRYIGMTPDNMVYDKSARTYIRGTQFEPLFLKPDASRYLSQLKSVADCILDCASAWIGQFPSYDMPRQHRCAASTQRRCAGWSLRSGEPRQSRSNTSRSPGPSLAGAGSCHMPSDSTAFVGTPQHSASPAVASRTSCSPGSLRPVAPSRAMSGQRLMAID
jgi:hypothetical protein